MKNKTNKIIISVCIGLIILATIIIIVFNLVNEKEKKSASEGEIIVEKNSESIDYSFEESDYSKEKILETTNSNTNNTESKTTVQFTVEETTAEEAVIEIERLEKTMYAISSANVRSVPKMESEVLGKLVSSQGVSVTGKTDEWYRINYNGAEGFVHYTLLSDVQAETQAETQTETYRQAENVEEKEPIVDNSNIPNYGENADNNSTGGNKKWDTSGYVDEVIRLVNVERAKYNLSPLVKSEKLCEAALARTNEIVQQFSHTRPNGTDCFTILGEYNISFKTVGENIAAGQPSPADVVELWMDSQGHRENILNEQFGHIGVGFLNGQKDYGQYWVQLFTE